MKLLALETSGQGCLVGLLVNDQVSSLFEIAPMRQAQIVLPMVEQILKQADLKLADLDALAFGCGPGSFTGVRLATSVAQGLGFSIPLPLIPISSLAALAQTAYLQLGGEKWAVAIDARMQEVYWATYEVQNGLVALEGQEMILPPSQVSLSLGAWSGVGNGWAVYHEELPRQVNQRYSELMPQAEGLLLLAKQKLINHHTVKPHEALPTYLRNQVAKKMQD